MARQVRSARSAALRLAAVGAAVALTAGLVSAPAAVAADEGLGKDAWWYQGMRIEAAHQKSTGKGVTIALIDSPVAPDVPELKNQRVVPVTNVCGGKATGSGPIADHGTRMATYIVGSGKGNGPGGAGVLGIAPGATLRTYADDASTADGFQCDTEQNLAEAAAFDAAVADGARIINYSAGTPSVHPEVTAAVKRAIAAGVVVVAAAGQSPEDSSVIYPAATPGVVAVAAIDRNAKPWEKNVTSGLEALVISAPGVDLPAAGFRGQEWDSTGTVSGTSESTALVSGGLALVMAAYPKATGNQIIAHLIHNVGGDGPFGRDKVYGYGIISVTEMLASDPAQWPDINPLLPAAAAPDGAAAVPAGQSGAVGQGDAARASGTGDESGGGVPAVLWVLLALAVLVVGAVVGVAVTRGRSRDRKPAAGTGASTGGSHTGASTGGWGS